MTVTAQHASQRHSSVAADDRPVHDAGRHTEATRRRQEALARLAQRRMPLPGQPLDGTVVTPRRTRPGRAHMTLVTSEVRADSNRPHCSCGTDSADTEHPALTIREIEVLRTWLMLDSKTAVAEALFISLGTVNTHLTRIRAKYSEAGRTASTKAALVARAVQDGLILLDEL
ncbi:response regulator transcription factor [Gordonia sp. DT218]|uniref:helix-turn-helix transcriptional regulator n=1 Tax=Gordonia sp. DT218 TaxID=3416659 RepID=UPI003CED3862